MLIDSEALEIYVFMHSVCLMRFQCQVNLLGILCNKVGSFENVDYVIIVR